MIAGAIGGDPPFEVACRYVATLRLRSVPRSLDHA